MSTRSFEMAADAVMRVAAVVLFAGVAGCAPVSPGLLRDEATVRAGLARGDGEAAVVGGEQGEDASPWSADPVLADLLAHARQASPDLRAARARLDAARAGADLAGRDSLPLVSIASRASESRLSTVEADPYGTDAPRPPRRTVLQAGISVAWEPDLIGRAGTRRAIAERGVDAEHASLVGAQALLEAEIVRLYVLYRERQAAVASLEESIRAGDGLLKDLAVRVDAGLVEPPALWEAKATQHAALAEHAVAVAGVQQARNQLLAACGIAPLGDEPLRARLLAPAAIPQPLGIGEFRVPADFLSRRPDVLAAEARARAAIGEAELARRAGWPTLNMLGSLATVALPGRLGDVASLSSGVGPALEWTWLDFGRNRLREAAARAGQDEAAATFEAAVLDAVSDADSAVRGWEAARRAWDEARSAASAGERTWQRLQARVAAGLEPRAALVAAQLQWLNAQRTEERAKAESIAAFAAMQLALGVDPVRLQASGERAGLRGSAEASGG